MARKTSLEQKILYTALAGLAIYFVVNMRKKGGTNPLPPGDTPPSGATISPNKANEIASTIKNSVSYTSHDVQRIDRSLWSLANDSDVKLLYQAFGNSWDGPGFVGGDLFETLNSVYASWVWDNASAINWTSIKNHLYGYGYKVNFS